MSLWPEPTSKGRVCPPPTPLPLRSTYRCPSSPATDTVSAVPQQGLPRGRACHVNQQRNQESGSGHQGPGSHTVRYTCVSLIPAQQCLRNIGKPYTNLAVTTQAAVTAALDCSTRTRHSKPLQRLACTHRRCSDCKAVHPAAPAAPLAFLCHASCMCTMQAPERQPYKPSDYKQALNIAINNPPFMHGNVKSNPTQVIDTHNHRHNHQHHNHHPGWFIQHCTETYRLRQPPQIHTTAATQWELCASEPSFEAEGIPPSCPQDRAARSKAQRSH